MRGTMSAQKVGGNHDKEGNKEVKKRREAYV